MEVKLCKKCGVVKDRQHYTQKLHKNGRHYSTTYCKPCTAKLHSGRNRINRLKAKQEWIEKFGGKCLDCSNKFPICVYEFHHLNPKDKDISPGQLFVMKKSKQESELAKCVMLCANCHRIRHYGN